LFGKELDVCDGRLLKKITQVWQLRRVFCRGDGSFVSFLLESFIKFYFIQHWDIEYPHNGAEMRIRVEKGS
jgi:hypothetical protein